VSTDYGNTSTHIRGACSPGVVRCWGKREKPAHSFILIYTSIDHDISVYIQAHLLPSTLIFCTDGEAGPGGSAAGWSLLPFCPLSRLSLSSSSREERMRAGGGGGREGKGRERESVMQGDGPPCSASG
jgi:hypothetical protein